MWNYMNYWGYIKFFSKACIMDYNFRQKWKAEWFHYDIPKDPEWIFLDCVARKLWGKGKVDLLKILLHLSGWNLIMLHTTFVSKHVWEFNEFEQLNAIRLQQPKFMTRWSPVAALLMQ